MESLAQHIKSLAKEVGFDACGLAAVELLDDDMEQLNHWLQEGCHAEMAYMGNHKAIRHNPDLLHQNAKTMLMTLSNYYPSTLQNTDAPQVAKYAYGRDYHKVLLKKHKQLLAKIQETTECTGRIFVDSAPVLERAWAQKAGLGWIGKSTNLISPTMGVHTMISGIALDIEMDHYDEPTENRCGKCTNCLKACPTKALRTPHRVDARTCISYLSIEHRGDYSSDDVSLHNAILGCDKCIDACPFAKRIAHQEAEFMPKEEFLTMDTEAWKQMTEEQYNTLFNGTPVRRAKYAGIQRNLNHL